MVTYYAVDTPYVMHILTGGITNIKAREVQK